MKARALLSLLAIHAPNDAVAQTHLSLGQCRDIPAVPCPDLSAPCPYCSATLTDLDQLRSLQAGPLVRSQNRVIRQVIARLRMKCIYANLLAMVEHPLSLQLVEAPCFHRPTLLLMHKRRGCITSSGNGRTGSALCRREGLRSYSHSDRTTAAGVRLQQEAEAVRISEDT